MKFSQKNIENWRFWKMTFFWVCHFIYFFQKITFFFDSSPLKLVTNYVLEWMGVNFYDYDVLQPKITPPKHFSRQCMWKSFKLLFGMKNWFYLLVLSWNQFFEKLVLDRDDNWMFWTHFWISCAILLSNFASNSDTCIESQFSWKTTQIMFKLQKDVIFEWIPHKVFLKIPFLDRTKRKLYAR